METIKSLTKEVAAATGSKKAQLVLKNARIVNVFTQSVETGDIAIEGGYIDDLCIFQHQFCFFASCGSCHLLSEQLTCFHVSPSSRIYPRNSFPLKCKVSKSNTAPGSTLFI